MKSLNVSYLYLSGVLALALLVAWGALMPEQINVNQLGGCHYCDGLKRVACGSHTGEPDDCTRTYFYCNYNKDASSICDEGAGGAAYCEGDRDCFPLKNDHCI
jgi:hypothetical protein